MIKETIEVLRQIYVVNELEKFYGEIVREGVSFDTLDFMKKLQLEGYAKIKHNALELIEAFGIKD